MLDRRDAICVAIAMSVVPLFAWLRLMYARLFEELTPSFVFPEAHRLLENYWLTYCVFVASFTIGAVLFAKRRSHLRKYRIMIAVTLSAISILGFLIGYTSVASNLYAL